MVATGNPSAHFLPIIYSMPPKPRVKHKVAKLAVGAVVVGLTAAAVVAQSRRPRNAQQPLAQKNARSIVAKDPDLLGAFESEDKVAFFLYSTLRNQQRYQELRVRPAGPNGMYPVSLSDKDTGQVVTEDDYSQFLSHDVRPLVRLKQTGFLAVKSYHWVPFFSCPPSTGEHDCVQEIKVEFENLNRKFVKELKKLSAMLAGLTGWDRAILRALCLLFARFITGAEAPPAQVMNMYAQASGLYKYLSQAGRHVFADMPAFTWAPVLQWTTTIPSLVIRQEKQSAVVGKEDELMLPIFDRMREANDSLGVAFLSVSSALGLRTLLSLKFFYLILDGKPDAWTNPETSTREIEDSNNKFFD